MGKTIPKYILAGTVAALFMLSACSPAENSVGTKTTTPTFSTSTLPPAVLTGWVEKDGSTYYNNHQGTPITGWLEVDGKLYYLDPQQGGAMITGWAEIDGSRYHLGSNGVMSTGWITLEDETYYLTPDGKLTTGWQSIDEKRYCFSDDGVMLTGWLESDGNTYYLHPDGHAARGKLEIDGKTHYFTSTGAEILLVNPWNSLPEGYEVELVQFSSVADGKIASICAGPLQEMWDACEAAGHRLNYCSGYRTNATQERYFNSWCNHLMGMGMTYEEAFEATKKEVAYPGTSEHQLGLAVDLTDYDFRTLDERQSQTATQQWLMANCWDYGFILRYPEGSTASTGIIYEPWHYRYVGLELAQELKALGIPLEEYLDQLTQEEAGQA